MVKPKREIPQRPSRLDKGEKDKRRRFARKKNRSKKSGKERKKAIKRGKESKKERKREPGARQTDKIRMGKKPPPHLVHYEL